MKILIAEDESDLREVLVFMLEKQFDAQVFEAASGNQAIQLLSEHPDVDVILSDYNMPNGNGYDVYKHVLQKKLTAHFILCTSDQREAHPEFQGQKQVSYMAKPFNGAELLRIIKENCTPKEKVKLASDTMPGFCRIKIISLMRMSSLACDLYLKLSKDKYIKVANSDDCLDVSDFVRFNNKGLEHLYIPRENADLFLDKLTREILSLKNAKSRVPSEDLRMSEKIQSIVHELTISIGFTPKIQEMIKANVELAITSMSSNPKLEQIFKDMFADKSSYICSHSVALAHVACGVAAQMDWQIESSLYKLAMAAFLHDITLKNEELAQLHTEDSIADSVLRGRQFTAEEIASFLRHPEEAAFLAVQVEDIPPNVDTIIAQHHESADGKGFPSHMNHTRIFPLSCVFIVAHDIVNAYWVKGHDFDINNFLKENETRYGFGYFKKIATAIVVNQATESSKN